MHAVCTRLCLCVGWVHYCRKHTHDVLHCTSPNHLLQSGIDRGFVTLYWRTFPNGCITMYGVLSEPDLLKAGTETDLVPRQIWYRDRSGTETDLVPRQIWYRDRSGTETEVDNRHLSTGEAQTRCVFLFPTFP